MGRVTQNDLNWIAARLLPEIYDINAQIKYDRVTRRLTSLHSELMKYRITEKTFFLHKERNPGEIMESQTGPYRYHVDGGLKRTPQFEEVSMTLTGYQPGAIKAAIEKAKSESQAKVAEAMAKLALAHTKATEEVPQAIKTYAAKIDKEASDALQELAEFDNGGPALDDNTAVPEHKFP